MVGLLGLDVGSLGCSFLAAFVSNDWCFNHNSIQGEVYARFKYSQLSIPRSQSSSPTSDISK